MSKAEPVWEMVLYGVCTKKLEQLGLKGPHSGRAVVEFKEGATTRSASSKAGGMEG